MTRNLSSILLVLLLVGIASAAEIRNSRNEVVDVFPPPRLESVPSFFVPAAGQSLDEGWVFDTVLVDAAPDRPTLFNAYPVDLEFNHAGRGFLAMIHTVFYTVDGGNTWQNMDPSPPPGGQSNWITVRDTAYITGLDVRPTLSDTISSDSLFISVADVFNAAGSLRLIIHSGSYSLDSYINAPLKKRYWLTGVEIVDGTRGVAFGGTNRTVLANDTLLGTLPSGATYSTNWDSVRHFFRDGWLAGETANSGGLIYAVGARQWISWDRGVSWNDYAPIDSSGDYGVSFADTLHGIVGGGTTSPSRGWIHRTTNAGFLWSNRTVTTNFPIRAVDLINDTIGFAAGGNFELASGQILETTDGGLTWNQDLATNAEIRTLNHVRVNAAYVDEFAAGGYPDYRCGIWRKRLFLPDSSSAILMATPDTLDFGIHDLHAQDTLYSTLHNYGIAPITISGVSGGDNQISPVYSFGDIVLAPNDSLVVPVIFTAASAGIIVRYLNVVNNLNQHVALYCRGEARQNSDLSQPSVIPLRADLSVWPNPGNQQFRIQFTLTQMSAVNLMIFDITGRLTQTLSAQQFPAGEHVQTWTAEGLSSGVYFIRLITPAGTVTKKVLLLK